MTPAASDLDPAELAALLHFYADSGVEWLLEDEPVDRIAQFAAMKAERAQARRPEPAPVVDRAALTPTRQTASPMAPNRQTSVGAASPAAPAAGSPAVAVPAAEAVAAARLAAESVGSLAELKVAVETFGGCNLKHGARSTIFASGDPSFGLMIVGPMPNAEDDREGLPFAGRHGQMLDRMLSAIGLERQKVLTTNIIPWRPPGNRMPSPAELDICRPFLERQISLAQPRRLLLLGNFPARFFFGGNSTIHSMRGEWRRLSFGGTELEAIATLHPQELLAASANKALAWRDMQVLKRRLIDDP